MKTRIITLLFLLGLLFSCEKMKELLTVNINTTLEGEFLIDIPVTAGGYATKTGNKQSFSATHTLDLLNNSDLKSYIDNIKEITLSNLEFTFLNLTPEYIIHHLKIDVQDVGYIIIIPINGISASNNILNAGSSSVTLLNASADKILNDKKLVITVSGEVSGPMEFNLLYTMDAKVVAEVLK